MAVDPLTAIGSIAVTITVREVVASLLKKKNGNSNGKFCSAHSGIITAQELNQKYLSEKITAIHETLNHIKENMATKGKGG